MNKNSEKANKYNKKNTKIYLVRLNKQTNKQLIEHMEKQPNKQGYIKSLIGQDMMNKLRSDHDLKSLN